MGKNTVLDEILETSIQVSANVSNTMLVVGAREYDRFCITNKTSERPMIISFEQLVHKALDAAATWVYEPAQNKITLSKLHGNEVISTQLPKQLVETTEVSLLKALEQFKLLPADENSKYCLIIDASLLFESITNPAGDEFQLLRVLDDHARNAGPHSFIVLRVAKASLLPQSLTANPYIRNIYMGSASQDTRFAYASIRCKRLAEKINTTIPLLSASIARSSDDWSLAAIDRLIEVALSAPEVKTLTDIDEMANIHRLGVTHSPWLGQQLRDQVKKAEAIMSERVKGQPHAISAVTSVLKKACTGLAGAHEGSKSRLPKAALMLAGPTGVGKTELAKTLAELIFGDPKTMIRFDMAEFRHDHSVSRLIGAPPGYVGFEAGGQLTESVKKKPACVILFDEVEKAHPRIWDIFLSILSDGRLTNGSGEVSDFSQCIIIFTSNLGIYSSQIDANGKELRTASFDMNTPYANINLKVRQAIKDEFVSIGRPEILGRLGGERSDNIIVFDYLRNVEAVVRKFTTNICVVTKQMHNVELKISDRLNSAIVQSTTEDQLLMGGRGVASNVDKLLTNPLAQYLFDLDDTPPGSVLACFSAGKTTFTPQ